MNLKNLTPSPSNFLCLFASYSSLPMCDTPSISNLEAKTLDTYKPCFGEFMTNVQIHHAKKFGFNIVKISDTPPFLNQDFP